MSCCFGRLCEGGSAKRLTIFPGARVQRMEYWKTTAEGSPLELDRQAVFDVIEQGAYARRIKPESSRQFLERFAYVSPVSRLGIYTLTVPRCRTD